MTIREQVRIILAENISTRNSDEELTMVYWHVYHGIKGPTINIRVMFGLPRLADLAKHRAVIQNKDKQYIPTVWTVAKARHWDKDEWGKLLGYAIYNPKKGE